ncbi:hypothetical protein TNIN_485421 [Trichonephila inaurata madagascariensis]|uniref:Uncharacterized protein n=1 Tax=Trichonephila inaurata madagascariensis TaxID=2747483 RepID=A0A8X6X5Y2_9ARAC|nr:hypothetical protein TNIN_485421 [Trichonephila inaurata madagascariensis]
MVCREGGVDFVGPLAQLVRASCYKREGRGVDPPHGQRLFSALFNCLEGSHRYRKMKKWYAEGESISSSPVSSVGWVSRANNAKVVGSIPSRAGLFFCTVQLFGREPSIQKMVAALKESRFRPPVSSVGWCFKALTLRSRVRSPTGPVFFSALFNCLEVVSSIQKNGMLKESRFRPPVSSVGWCVVKVNNAKVGFDSLTGQSFFLHFSIVCKGAIDTEKWYAEGEVEFVGLVSSVG